jgi:two-component system, LytTR family, sensor kinase
MLGTLSPVVLLLNGLLFGQKYFTSLGVFIPATIATYIVEAVTWQFHTLVAVILRERFPNENQLAPRLTVAILIFVLMTSLDTTFVFWGYDKIHFLGYTFNEVRYAWAIGIGIIINIFVTFLHEWASKFESWKTTLQETEQLKKEYMQSQLLGLKSQVNPHFLFNCLNSLSSLINEQPDKAEAFLDEMSKVYRYLLRNDEDMLVMLKTELQFMRSYYYLLKVRYGDGIELHMNVTEQDQEKSLPPLTLQILLENAFQTNSVSKTSPLFIEIFSGDNGWLVMKNNVQKKQVPKETNTDIGLENVGNKFRLLCNRSMSIYQDAGIREITMPLIPSNKNPSL